MRREVKTQGERWKQKGGWTNRGEMPVGTKEFLDGGFKRIELEIQNTSGWPPGMPQLDILEVVPFSVLPLGLVG